jgi:hypothetical protein
MELSLNEEGQILLRKEGMAAWVKEVSGESLSTADYFLIIPGLSPDTRQGITRKL